MSTVPAKEPLSASQDYANLLRLLVEGYSANDLRMRTQQAAQQANENYAQQANSTQDTVDKYKSLLEALRSRFGQNPEEEINNRAAQYYANETADLDRTAAQVASQGFAQSLKRGMGDSTQAGDQSVELARRLAPLYQKARNNSNQQALDYYLKTRGVDQNAMQTATVGLANLQRGALDTAGQMQQRAAQSANSATTRLGEVATNAIASKGMDWLGKKADAYLGLNQPKPNNPVQPRQPDYPDVGGSFQAPPSAPKRPDDWDGFAAAPAAPFKPSAPTYNAPSAWDGFAQPQAPSFNSNTWADDDWFSY